MRNNEEIDSERIFREVEEAIGGNETGNNEEIDDIELIGVLSDDMSEDNEYEFHGKQVKEIADIARYVFSEEREELLDAMHSISQRRYDELREQARNDFNSSLLDYEIRRKRKEMTDMVLGFIFWISWGVVCFLAGKGAIL